MANEVAIIVIHGMGTQTPGFSNPLKDEIKDKLGSKAPQTHWGEVYWADILKKRQDQYLKSANSDNTLDCFALRKFVVSAFGDATAYRKTSDKKNNTYNRIHNKVGEVLDDLEQKVPTGTPLIVLAHSLGAHIMSNFIWDIQKPGVSTGLSDFRAMKTHAGMITFGSNIPLFILAYAKDDIKPIKFPGSKLCTSIKDKSRWNNYYDPDGVLGYPLRAINKSYSDVVDKDIPINVGGVFSSWNPLSHSKYWTDDDFTKPVTKFIKSLL